MILSRRGDALPLETSDLERFIRALEGISRRAKVPKPATSVVDSSSSSSCNYFGNQEVGQFLRAILDLGATRDWDAVLREATGESLTARPMMEYFAPLLVWLKDQNAGRKVGWA
jgi:hypothetical protein